MKCQLRYVLDDFGKIGVTLKEFDSLEEMDDYMQAFKDSNEVKKVYLSKINEFLKTKPAEELLHKVKQENNGYIKGYAPYKDGRMHHIHLLYEGTLLDEKICYKILRDELRKISVLSDIYKRKYHLLPSKPTLFLKDELRYCVVHHGTSRIFIKEFIKYIQSLDPTERYFVLRSLSDKCSLANEDKKETKNVYKIRHEYLNKLEGGYELVKVTHYSFGDYTKEEVQEMAKDGKYFTRKSGLAPNKKDSELAEFEGKSVEELLEQFDIDEIDRNTNYFDALGGRKK